MRRVPGYTPLEKINRNLALEYKLYIKRTEILKAFPEEFEYKNNKSRNVTNSSRKYIRNRNSSNFQRISAITAESENASTNYNSSFSAQVSSNNPQTTSVNYPKPYMLVTKI